MNPDANATGAAAFLALVAGRRGHFRMESGLHSALWLELDTLFASSSRIVPFVDALVDALRTHQIDAVCGPLLGGAFLAQLAAQRLETEFHFTERIVPAPEPGPAAELYRVTYRLPPASAARLAGKRVAIVDDVMSAGSALRGTYAALEACGAFPVVAGALLILGDKGERFFAGHGVPVVALAREPFAMWTPQECPLCAAGTPLEDIAG